MSHKEAIGRTNLFTLPQKYKMLNYKINKGNGENREMLESMDPFWLRCGLAYLNIKFNFELSLIFSLLDDLFIEFLAFPFETIEQLASNLIIFSQLDDLFILGWIKYPSSACACGSAYLFMHACYRI